MRILILSTKLPYPPKDGGAIATLGLAEGLADAGAEVTLLAINTKKHYFPVEEIPDRMKKKIRFLAVPRDTSPRLLPALINLLFSRRPYISERFKSKAYASRLATLLQEEKFDIVQMEGPYLAHLVPVIRRYANVKISLRAHNIEHEIWERRASHTGSFPERFYFSLLAKRIGKLEKSMARQADLVVAISERDRVRLAKFNPEAATITVPAGIDLRKYKSAPPASEVWPCFIGALDWAPNEEGLRWFINRVMPILREKQPGILVHVAGRNAPKELVSLLRSIPGIQYHGEVDDALDFMRSGSILVVPLLTGSGIRIKILEGMACGMSVITSPVGAEGIDAGDDRHLLIADSPEEFARNIQHTMTDPALRERLGNEARKLAKEKFDTFTIASGLLGFYKRSV